MTKVKLILEGVHDNHYFDDGSYLVEPFTSSVTLVQTEKNNVLVDTGTFPFQRSLLEKLAKKGLQPAAIDSVVLTHNHMDHTFNAHLFPNAHVYTKASVCCLKTASSHIFSKRISENIIPEIKLVQTPGHTLDSLSVYVQDSDGKKWVIAGDAVNLHYLENGTMLQRIGPEGVQSIQKILSFNPDFIIPGHGNILGRLEIDKLATFVK